MTYLRGTIHVSPPACDPFSNAGVSYSVHGILSRSLNAVIVMQMVICHSQSWEKSALLVTDQPRSRHTVHVVICHSHGWQQSVLLIPGQPRSKHRVHVAVTTGRRELTETLPPTRNATAQPGSSWPRRREAFLPLARSYRMKGMPRASLHSRGRRGSHCREDCDGATARRRQRAAITLVSRAVRCHPEE
jgi:hypothetical protein